MRLRPEGSSIGPLTPLMLGNQWRTTCSRRPTLLTHRSGFTNVPLSGACRVAPDPHAGQVQPVALMLKGMAAECLLKAFWLKGGNILGADGRFRPVPGAPTHNLPKLASACKFSVTPAESHLLQRLSHFIEYGGRYPVPKDPQKLNLLPTPDGGFSAATTWSTPSDDKVFEALVHRLQEA